jgi:hypothetical protein
VTDAAQALAAVPAAPPRWSTPRTPGRPTVGADVAKVAARLGTPLMPHQRLIADVAGEVLPSGRMAYPIVVLLLPRRAGKSALLLPTALQRCAWIRRGRCWYTAQTGQDAAAYFREDWLPKVKPLGTAVKARLSNGSMSLTVNRTGGQVGLFAPGPKALHGKDADMPMVDEAWAFDAVQGSELETAMRPPMLTRKRRQLWIVSAGGTDDSTWLLRWRELGRAVDAQPDQGIAYFEWHPEVDDQGNPVGDLDDPALWAQVHPAVGHTIDLDVLREDHKTFGAAEFHRSYLNVFQTSLTPRLFPQAAWDQAKDVTARLDPGRDRPAVSYDVDPTTRQTAAVTISGRLPDGRLGLRVVDHRPGGGLDWVADRVAGLRDRGAQVVADSRGPAVGITRALRAKGVEVEELDTNDVGTASQELLDDLLGTVPDRPDARRLAHNGQDMLDRAARDARKRDLGDGGWALGRKASGDDVTPLVSGSFAAWKARHTTATAPAIETLDDLRALAAAG